MLTTTIKTKKIAFLLYFLLIAFFIGILIYFKPVSKYRFYHKMYHNTEIREMMLTYHRFIHEYKLVFGKYPNKNEFLRFFNKAYLLESDLLEKEIEINHEIIDGYFALTIHSTSFKTRRLTNFINKNESSYFEFLLTGELFEFCDVKDDSAFCEPRRPAINLISDGRRVDNKELRSQLVDIIITLQADFLKKENIKGSYMAYCGFSKADNEIFIVCEDNAMPDNLDLLFDPLTNSFQKELINEDVDFIYFEISWKYKE